jgi:hypothetical protein
LVIGNVEKLIELVKPTVNGVHALLVDDGLTGAALEVAGGLGMTEIVSTRVRRRILTGWTQTMIVVDHTIVGGVTDTILQMSRLHKGTAIGDRPRIATAAPRDMSTILDVKGNKVVFLDAPEMVTVTPLAVVNLARPGAVPHYYGGGLLPHHVCSMRTSRRANIRRRTQ